MPDKYEKFAPESRQVFTFAQEEAQRLNHNYIGTEHLLLGLLRREDSRAARVLDSFGVQLPRVRLAVESRIGRGDGLVAGEPGLTPHAKKVIELAMDEARRIQDSPGSPVGTVHLLLGIVREGEGIAAQILETLDVDLERVQSAVLARLSAVDSTDSVRPPYGGTIVNAGHGQFVYGLVLSVEMLTKLTDVARESNRPLGNLIREAIALYLLPPADADTPETELPPPQNDSPIQP